MVQLYHKTGRNRIYSTRNFFWGVTTESLSQHDRKKTHIFVTICLSWIIKNSLEAGDLSSQKAIIMTRSDQSKYNQHLFRPCDQGPPNSKPLFLCLLCLFKHYQLFGLPHVWITIKSCKLQIFFKGFRPGFLLGITCLQSGKQSFQSRRRNLMQCKDLYLNIFGVW